MLMLLSSSSDVSNDLLEQIDSAPGLADAFDICFKELSTRLSKNKNSVQELEFNQLSLKLQLEEERSKAASGVQAVTAELASQLRAAQDELTEMKASVQAMPELQAANADLTKQLENSEEAIQMHEANATVLHP